ncbi:nicotinate-nucleotide--dimethylbenzimidazole phosphoribosyltransferase [Tianweitania sp. BSSL-BM11]|uniref:Nicotinate-nucleotide--dimethylbenzimidazole phosphoribosyltransferase n=1 Tax=Tianweitania aestuarii TaxID=2814886 RepID=A0ABS5RUP1_9HYPH|nr:nicotinate-nucleotide--dimethylbenzimidazole phosphoribosyltransferase [Tianweitania aestuarii]MBS9720759.1 nicotinate-nucleotide--dimethylbenzimidazole phosphoribosyltransferase [Tianweitania aestuarii]
MTSALPFDDFRALLRDMPEANSFAGNRVRERITQLGGAGAGLGRLGEIADWLTTWSSRPPAVNRPLIALFAGNHGIAAQGLGAEAIADTAAMVDHCAAGGAAVSQVCGAHDLGLKVFDLALDVPTADFTGAAAFDERGCAATMAFGMEAVAGGFDLVALSSFGVGGELTAAAVVTALQGGKAADWIVAEGAMADRQAEMIDAALAFHGAGNLRDPLEVLRRVGGREIAAMAGAIMAARSERIPVLLDGYPALAAAALLRAVNPDAVSHCRVASSMGQPAADRLAGLLSDKPLLDLGASQPGLAAALAALLVQSTAQVFNGVRALPAA